MIPFNFVVALLIGSVWLQQQVAAQSFIRSSDLGISTCSLHGEVEDQPALLHIFMTACSGPPAAAAEAAGGSGRAAGASGRSSAHGAAANSSTPTLYISGLFFLHNPAEPVKTTQISMSSSTKNWAGKPGALRLTSPHTGRSWPLRLQMCQPWSHVYRRRYPGRLSAALTDLDPVDAALMEFHVVARPGFHTFCTFLAATARAPAWPPIQPAPFEQLMTAAGAGAGVAGGAAAGGAAGGASSSGSSTGVGLQQCGWLDAQGREITDLVAAEAEDKLHSYMVVSPFFGLPAAEYASLLLHHMRYHDVLGVRRYLVYVEAGASALAAEPRVQALMAAGRLRLVYWQELPNFMDGNSKKRHPYASQILIYNHGLLALWHELAVAAIADVDEYLVTPQPATLAQVMTQCGDPSAAEEAVELSERKKRKAGIVDAPAGDGGDEDGEGAAPPPTAILYIKRRAAFCTGCCACEASSNGSSSSNSSSSSTGSASSSSSSTNSSTMLSLRAADLLAAHMAVEKPMWVAGGDGGGGGGNASALLVAAFQAATAAGGQLLAGDVGGAEGAAPSAGSSSTDSSGSSSSSSGGLRLTHPLVLYGGDVVDMQETKGITLPKSIALPHRTAYTNPHTPFPMNLLLPSDHQTAAQAAAEVAPRGVAGFTGPPMLRVATAKSGCVHWLHLRAQVSARVPKPDPAGRVALERIPRHFLWVLDRLPTLPEAAAAATEEEAEQEAEAER